MASAADPTQRFDLGRFVTAQDGGVYDRAAAELRRGRKVGHWMWFVFPQLAGLGSSPTAVHYAIRTLPEATAYLRHPVLGQRLVAVSAMLLELPADVTAEQVFGAVDAMKLRSSMTLFNRADPTAPVFRAVLDRWFGGGADSATLRLLGD